MKTWTKPEYQLIDMNSEIGSYQEDFGDEPDPVGRAGTEVEGAPAAERESAAAKTGMSDQPAIAAAAASA